MGVAFHADERESPKRGGTRGFSRFRRGETLTGGGNIPSAWFGSGPLVTLLVFLGDERYNPIFAHFGPSDGQIITGET